MDEFNVLEDTGHSSINSSMIEKCTGLALQYHREIEQKDAIDDDKTDDASDNESNLGQEDPQDPPAAASIDPEEQGGDDGSKQGKIGPLAMV
jgi:hypothetical protein